MLFRKAHEPFGFRVRQGPQQHAVDDRKDRCGRADAERKRQQAAAVKLLLRRIIVSAYRTSRSSISIGTDYTQNLKLAAVGSQLAAIGSKLRAIGIRPTGDNDLRELKADS
jgi:hypothetical protein